MARGRQKALPNSTTKDVSFPQISRKQGLVAEHLDGPGIFQVEGVLSAQEAGAFVKAAESIGFQHQASRGPKFGEAYRDNGRVGVDSPSLADGLWEFGGLCQLFGNITVAGHRAVGLNPAIRFYKYEKGQRFGKHVDDSNPVARWPGSHTAYTLLVYLTGGHQSAGKQHSTGGVLRGGQTVFYGNRGKQVASVDPVAGRALLHRHGDDCLEHEALEVTSGIKYILRSDVVFAA
ncbi:hypothetical protein WJX72_005176 [[Myrmecia] bisecta]|uniref:Fe2OG dioxygenase domain-containing protein n=1 Tax=[Myrmecia] bisecta TaxID=41462 RepID=A0AAW1QQM5_9CHLO